MKESDFLKTHDYKKWEIKDSENYDWEKVIYDGHCYVIMDDKTRYDSSEDIYRESRLLWNSLKDKNYAYIKIGRWIITNEGIETKKVNDETIIFNNSEIWSYEKKGENLVYEIPLYLCSLSWISNLDLLDYNNCFLVYQEIFKSLKPQNYPEISWSQTLRRQYKRFENSLDINSFEGRKQHEFEAEYRETLSMEDILKISRVTIETEPNKNEIFGDELSRNK